MLYLRGTLPLVLAIPVSMANAQSTAEEDAAYAVRVYEQELTKSRRLSAQGVVSDDALDNLRLRLNYAQTQYAIAIGSSQKVLGKLVSDRVQISQRRLDRAERLAGKGVVTVTALEIVRHDHRETLIALSQHQGNHLEIVRLLKEQVAGAQKHLERSQKLVQRRIVPAVELAAERLHLAELKNRLEAAIRNTVEELPPNTI